MPRRRPIIASCLLVALAATACTAAVSEDVPAAEAPAGTTPSGRTVPPPPPPEPDELADPGVAPGECETIVYTPPTATQEQEGELCRPEVPQRDVAVVIVHGGGGYSGSYHGLRPWADRLLAEGYVTFLPSYQLFSPGIESPVFPLPEQDIMAAVQYVHGTGNALGIRKDRIVVQGHSAGARIGSVAYTAGQDPWFAGDELYPGISTEVNGFIGFYHPYDGSMENAAQYYGGPEESTSELVLERWARADAIANAAEVEGPALLISGTEDWDVIDAQMDLMCEAVRAQGQDCEEIFVEGGGHGFDQGTATRLSRLGEQAATDVLRWLNEQFPQDPAREAQTVDPDLEEAPSSTGQTPTTYRQRSSGSSYGSGTGYGTGSASGQTTTTNAGETGMTSTTGYVPPTSSIPEITVPPTTVPDTTAPPPTTAPPTTAPPTTAAP